MLATLLETLAGLGKPENSSLRVVIVENGPLTLSGKVVEKFSGELDIAYHHEPRSGLAIARNAVIERALDTGADWIGFIDDDERVDPGWLLAMCDAVQRFSEARVFSGPVQRYDPPDATKWYPGPVNIHVETGTQVWNITTGNLFVKRDVLAKEGLGFRFDEVFNMSGGEDTDFALRLRKAGVNIVWVQEAACEEDVLPERATFKAKAARSIHYMHNFGRINIRLKGPVLGRLYNLFLAVKWAYHSLAYFLVGSLVLMMNEEKGVKLIARGLQRGCLAIGYAQSLFQDLKPFYATVDGH